MIATSVLVGKNVKDFVFWKYIRDHVEQLHLKQRQYCNRQYRTGSNRKPLCHNK